MTNKNARLSLVLTMMLFGTIGTISRFINMPSSIICLGRAAVGVLVILLLLKLRKESIDKEAIKRNIGWLILSSTLMCLNWTCQFEAFKYTTIATSTLCYYMQPIFYIVAGAIVLKERASFRKWICVLVAFLGMIFVSGVIQVGFDISELRGAIYGVVGGFFYAMVVLINKYMKDISPVNTTIMQMALVTVIMTPYAFVTGDFGKISITGLGVVCLIILGAVHTGLAYIVYFDSVNKLSTQTVGILSYIDPVEAVLLSALFLKEPITVWTIVGAILILGATAVSEFSKDVVK